MDFKALAVLCALTCAGFLRAQEGAPPPSAASDPAYADAPQLVFGIVWPGSSGVGDTIVDHMTRRSPVQQAVRLDSIADGKNVDVIVQCISRGDRLRMMSAYSRKVLAEGRYSMWNYKTAGTSMGREIHRYFQPGTPLYKQVVEEREAARKPAGSISKEDIQAIVRAAALGAAAEKKPSSPKEISSDADTPRYRGSPRPDDFAVVVGVEEYPSLPDAPFAERDAKAVKAHLLALGVPERNIALLTGQAASRAGIVKHIEVWLARNVKPDSTVYFYYSGHGAPNIEDGEAYLVPVDGDPQYLGVTAYPVSRLYEKLDALPAENVVVALDSCFSGAGGRSVLARGTRPLVTKIKTLPRPGRIAVLTAAAADEISGTLEAQGHGAFTYYLLRGLNGAARDADGAVTLRSLHEYLAPNVQDAARRENRDQTPTFSGPALKLR